MFDDYNFSGEIVPANPNEVLLPTQILNQTNSSGIADAYTAFDLRESYLQRHLSPLAS